MTVRINGSEISKDTLQKYVWELPSDEKENKELKEYYDLLTRTDRKIVVIPLKVSEYGEKYGFKDGECELRLKEGNDLNSRILLTRRSGMRLFEQDHISGSIKFTGVLLMNGANMNAAFRKMEVPSHDAWAPDRIKDPKEKRKAGKPASVYINTENDDYLMLGIDEKLYDTYFGLGKGKYRETVFSLLFMPALVVVLSRMCHASQSGENYFEEKKWYQAIVDLLERAGYTLDSLSEDNETLLEAVQVIFKNPISRALNELSTNNDVEE